MMDDESNSGRDEAVWFSFLCAAVAMIGVFRYPSVGMNLIFILILGWFLWTLWQMSADRFE